ncbi:MAG: hypothetical protein IIC84_01910, partial [Chloroflexi bacterium]|nr:hypothetical protein [Chloroflexota bacterium]
MRILGIGDHVSCGSAVVQDGKLISAINDERLVREKMVFGIPRESIKAQMEMHGITAKDIDGIAIATQRQHFYDHYVDFKDGWFGLQRSSYKKTLFDVASKFSKYRRQIPMLESAYYAIRQPSFNKRRNGLTKILREEFGFDCPIKFLDHHYCHATSAYYTSGMTNSTVVTMDGGGDGKSGKIYKVTNGLFQELKSISSFDSMGTFYSYVTQICGFKAGRHEGKITGLAAYGEPVLIPELKQMLVEENGGLRNVSNTFFLSALDELERLLPADFNHRDLAASVQQYSEDMVVALVEHWLKQTNYSDIGLAGGVFANVKINQRVHEIPGVDSVFVHPGMSDEGVPVGAALGMYYEMSGAKYDPDFATMDHVYLGPEYSDEEIGRVLEAEGVEATLHDEAEPEIARLLADGAVVARFNGRMEYGPRALGNRTILYTATDPTVNYWMNEALQRTEFMPFAPITTKELAKRCFIGWEPHHITTNFMTECYDVTEEMKKDSPAVVHIDGTARPQIIEREDNPFYYDVVTAWHKKTGALSLINTSFNEHEEPIVCTIEDAIESLLNNNVDCLVVN